MSLKEIDEKLDLLREAWQDAQPSYKDKWMKRIYETLDERLKCLP